MKGIMKGDIDLNGGEGGVAVSLRLGVMGTAGGKYGAGKNM